MDALVASFVAAFLCGWGDKTQLLLAVLVGRTGRTGPVVVATVIAVAAGHLFAGYAGGALTGAISIQAASLLLGIALIVSGLGGLIGRRPPDPGSLRLPLFAAALIMALAAQIADRAPFVTFALAARFDAPLLAAAGGIAGTLAACLPALALGDRLRTATRAFRWTGAALFLIAGLAVALAALRLV